MDEDEAADYVKQVLTRNGLIDTYDVFESCDRHRAGDLMLGHSPGEWWQDIEADESVWVCRLTSSDTNEVATVVIAPPRFGNPLPEPKVSTGIIGGKVVQSGKPPWPMYGAPRPPRPKM